MICGNGEKAVISTSSPKGDPFELTFLTTRVRTILKKVIKKLIFMQKLIHIHLYTVDY